MKKIVTFLVTLAFFVLSMSSANAQFAGGNGTEANPYQIAKPSQLGKLAELVNSGNNQYNSAYYVLTRDIDLSYYQAGEGWTPIGLDMSRPFMGHFDGAKRKITGLKISGYRPNAGLFGHINYGSVKNLAVENAYIFTSVYDTLFVFAGAIAGRIDGTSISNCYSTGVVYSYSPPQARGAIAGGLVGIVVLGSEISNCYSSATVIAETYMNNDAWAGGIAGEPSTDVKITSCYSTGMILTLGYYPEVCGRAGGIVGSMNSGCKISNCAGLNPSIASTQHTAARIGSAFEPSNEFSNNIGFKNIMNLSKTVNPWVNDANGKDGKDITIAEIFADGTLGGRFTSANGWKTENGKLPQLLGFTEETPLHLQNASGTEDDPYLIWTMADLKCLADYVNNDYHLGMKHYKLMNNLHYPESFFWWTPIGTDMNDHQHYFQGNFNGNYKTISGIRVSSDKYAGLFGFVFGGTIRNLGVENIYIDNRYSVGTGNLVYTGALVAVQNGGKILNCYSTGEIHVSHNVTGNSFLAGAGGIVGRLQTGSFGESEISNCYSSVSVDARITSVSTSYSAGGIVGEADCKVSNCYSTGMVSVGDSENIVRAGGIVGFQNLYSSISDCAALNYGVACPQSPKKQYGRIVGKLSTDGKLINNVAFNNMLGTDSTTVWSNKGLDKMDGADITAVQINADGTLDGRFSLNGWKAANGFLPGLIDGPEPIPFHLQIETGTPENPYLIYSAKQLSDLAQHVNGMVFFTSGYWMDMKLSDKSFKLMKDIDLSAYNWDPIGRNDWNTFRGNFDGNNKVISGIRISGFAPFAGLFGYAYGGTFKNLGIKDSYINMHLDDANTFEAGLLAGCMECCTIKNCYTKGEVHITSLFAHTYAGGIVGRLKGVPNQWGSLMADCFSTAKVTSRYIQSAYAPGNSYAGGLIGGFSGTGTVTSCYATGEVTSMSDSIAFAGGLVGISGSYCTISNSAALNPRITTNDKEHFARITRSFGPDLISFSLENNIGFIDMFNPDNTTIWLNKGLDNFDGADITEGQILEDGTLGGRFVSTRGGWSTQNGYLPGLFGQPEPLPRHLGGTDKVKTWKDDDGIKVYPNPTNGELRIENGELRIKGVELYDVFGRKVYEDNNSYGLTILRSYDLTPFPAGVYFLKITTETGIVSKKIIKN